MNARKRIKRFIFSKYNGRCKIYIQYTLYGTRQSDLCTSKCNIATCCFDTPIDMILLHLLLTALTESYLLSLLLSSFLSLDSLFFVICTPNRTELLQCYGNSGGGSSGSRKSQINPFVIPHRSFQPVRISSTRFYATSASSRNSSFFSSAPFAILSREDCSIVSIFTSFLLFPSHITLFSPFFLLTFLSRIFIIFVLAFLFYFSFFLRSSLIRTFRFYYLISPVLLSRFASGSTPCIHHLFASPVRNPQ